MAGRSDRLTIVRLVVASEGGSLVLLPEAVRRIAYRVFEHKKREAERLGRQSFSGPIVVRRSAARRERPIPTLQAFVQAGSNGILHD